MCMCVVDVTPACYAVTAKSAYSFFLLAAKKHMFFIGTIII